MVNTLGFIPIPEHGNKPSPCWATPTHPVASSLVANIALQSIFRKSAPEFIFSLSSHIGLELQVQLHGYI